MKTLAIYAGSFNPFHIGHLNIVEKTEEIFGKENVLIAIGVNPSKTDNNQSALDAAYQRAIKLGEKTGKNVEVYFSFLHELIDKKENEGFNVVLVRGLRNGDDLFHENNQLSFIEDFKPNVKSIFIMCDKKFEHISSSAIRTLESFRVGSSENYMI